MFKLMLGGPTQFQARFPPVPFCMRISQAGDRLHGVSVEVLHITCTAEKSPGPLSLSQVLTVSIAVPTERYPC